MHKLYELKEKLMRELEDYSENGKFSKEDVEAIKYITSSIDHICNIVEGEEGEYSNTYGGDMGRSYAGRDGRSYAGRRNARRDSMGRYSRGYSMAEDDFRMGFEDLLNTAPNERIKAKMREIMRDM